MDCGQTVRMTGCDSGLSAFTRKESFELSKLNFPEHFPCEASTGGDAQCHVHVTGAVTKGQRASERCSDVFCVVMTSPQGLPCYSVNCHPTVHLIRRYTAAPATCSIVKWTGSCFPRLVSNRCPPTAKRFDLWFIKRSSSDRLTSLVWCLFIAVSCRCQRGCVSITVVVHKLLASCIS